MISTSLEYICEIYSSSSAVPYGFQGSGFQWKHFHVKMQLNGMVNGSRTQAAGLIEYLILKMRTQKGRHC